MRFLLSLFLLLLVAGFSWPVLAVTTEIMPIQVWNGDDGVADRQETAIITTQDQWLKIWQRTEQKTMIQPLLKGQMAVAMFAGTRATSGYRLEIREVVDKGQKITVVYRLLKPSQTRLQAGPYQTSPWVIVLLPYSEEPIVFHQEKYPFMHYITLIGRGIGDFFERLLVTGIHSKPQPE